jgi:hypothetical protein
MATFSTSQTYILTNSFLGSTKQLSSSASNVPTMDLPNSDSAEQWYLTTSAMQNYYFMHTRALGDNMVLDVLNNNGVNSTTVVFTTIAATSGQLWRFDSWGDGTYRLSNDFTGPSVFLDTYSDTYQPFLDGGDHSGQHWTFNTYATPASSSSAKTSAASSTGTSAPSTTGASSPSMSTVTTPNDPVNMNNGGGGISAGAIAGAAVGGLAALLLIIGALLFFIMKQRRKTNNTSRLETDTSGRPGSSDKYVVDGGDSLNHPHFNPPEVVNVPIYETPQPVTQRIAELPAGNGA